MKISKAASQLDIPRSRIRRAIANGHLKSKQKGYGKSATKGSSSPVPCSPLGKLHKWWLREFRHHTKLMIAYSYAGTPHGNAVIGLMNRGLIKFVAGFEGAGLVELTPEGIKAKESLANDLGAPAPKITNQT